MRATLLVLLLSLFLTGCGSLLGGLRRDLDDSETMSQPTVGGAWSERGYLTDEDRYQAVGHAERAPAGAARARTSWLNEDSAEDSAAGAVQSLAPPMRRLYKGASGRATRADFVDDSQNEGSLWASDGQTNYYFTKNKIRGVGDIVTISVEQELIKDLSNEIARTLTKDEREAEIDAAQERLKAKASGGGESKDSVTSSSAAPARGPASGDKKAESADVPTATAADIDVSKSLELKAGDPIMAEIIERYPNGNYKVRGVKRVRYRNSTRLVNVVAVVRGSDISEEDVVNSGKLYEYRLEANR